MVEDVKNLTVGNYIWCVNHWEQERRKKFYNKWNVFMKLREWPHK